MDPTVITAAIGVGGTVIVGVVGFWSTKTASDKAAQVATDNTARALDAARDERIWDRRARAYEQSVAALLYRRQQRRQELAELVALPAAGLRPLGRTYALWQEQVSLPDHPFFDRYPSGWFEVEGTLLAYATPKVITALDAARQADDAARIALGRCRKLSGKGTRLTIFSRTPTPHRRKLGSPTQTLRRNWRQRRRPCGLRLERLSRRTTISSTPSVMT
jgi:hypothetical protein